VRIALACLLAACVFPRVAHAGRTYYGWLFGTDVMPERGVELQSWIQEENDKYGTRSKESWVSWAAMVGVTDQLELGLPVEIVWAAIEQNDGTTRTTSAFKRFGIEARYRFAPADPAEAPPLVPLLRLAVKRDVIVRNAVRLEGDAVVSYSAGAVHAVFDLGAVGDITPSSRHLELRPSAGVSVLATSELRLGAEVYSEISFDTTVESWATIGPDLSWSHGRFWISGMLGIGLYHVRIAPRVVWGIAF
jgi:hypothetical protein